MENNEQISFWDEIEEQEKGNTNSIEVVMAQFEHSQKMTWQQLFQGFDEMYAITFSSGIRFVDQVLDEFSYAEVIFGCENVIGHEIATIIAAQIETVKQLVKTKTAVHIAEKLETQQVKLFVSRDTRSHEKIYILKANDGRTRVITGSANMSASAFCGMQRENIVYYDDLKAFEYYKALYESFRDLCTDEISKSAVQATIKDRDFLSDHPEEIPILKTVENKMLFLEEQKTEEDLETIEFVANVKGHEAELKPMLPKPKRENKKMILTNDWAKGFSRKSKEHREQKKERERRLPKLHIEYETRTMNFNGKSYDLRPSQELILKDAKCLDGYLASLNSFYGDVEQSQRDYFRFLTWCFASPFMPYLRRIAKINGYNATAFPVFGIIYGESNGGKTTFMQLVTKLMCGHRVPTNSSDDFTATRIEDLKRGCEGLPIIIDDLAKLQFSNHSEKIIKNDEWGILEGFLNYPSVVITTNKIPALSPDITKRAVACHIDVRIDKDTGIRNSKKVNESMRAASTALFSEFSRQMLEKVSQMEDNMKTAGDEYFPDIFEASSQILVNILSESLGNCPKYADVLSYRDFFGDTAIGRNAIQKVLDAWNTDSKLFETDKKQNTLKLNFPDSGRSYELRYIKDELPPSLNVKLVPRGLVMDLDKAKEVFGVTFRKGLFASR